MDETGIEFTCVVIWRCKLRNRILIPVEAIGIDYLVNYFQ